jgi:hypothetical protein
MMSQGLPLKRITSPFVMFVVEAMCLV